MNNTLKWVLIVVVAIIVILLILPFLIPVNKFKPEIEQKASQALGRQVQLGNLSLSILGGSLGVDNLSVADDPKFGSQPFLTAKNVKVGVELMPLIFSKQLNVTEVRIVEPQVTLLKDPSGKWNFSSIGAGGTQEKAAPSGTSASAQQLSIAKLSLENGQMTVGSTNSKKRSVYTNMNLTATDVALNKNFPLTFSANLPGGGTVNLDGKVGPENATDASLTPVNAKLVEKGLNLASTGFLDPSLGLSGVVDVDATVESKDGKASTKGTATLTKAVLIQGGSPSTVPAVVNFDTTYDLDKSTGVLNPSSLVIGNAKSNLSGTYKMVGDEFAVDMKVTGQGLPATDLENFLPALAIHLPEGSRLSAGTMNTNLHITGPTNKLVTDGNIGLFNGKLSGFNLGQKLSGVASLASVKTGNDLEIEKFTTDVHMAPTGLETKNMNLVVPSMGTVVGGGTLDSKNQLNFNLVASVTGGVAGAAAGGAVGKVMGGGTNCKSGMKVPLQVHGTTSNPQFVPDVGGVASGLLKSELGCAGGNIPGLGGQTGNPAQGLQNLIKKPKF